MYLFHDGMMHASMSVVLHLLSAFGFEMRHKPRPGFSLDKGIWSDLVESNFIVEIR